GPAEFIVGSAIALGRIDDPPSTLVLADWMARLGQDLFYPPNVGGWTGGRSWLSSRSLIGRANFASALVEGLPVGCSVPLDVSAFTARQQKHGDLGGARDAAASVLLSVMPEDSWLEHVPPAPGTNHAPVDFRRAVALVLASPEAQLG